MLLLPVSSLRPIALAIGFFKYPGFQDNLFSMLNCKGKCILHKASRSLKNSHYSHYLSNHKRCQVCQIFLKWDKDSRCPCCKSKLRTKPRNSKIKERFHRSRVMEHDRY